MRYALYSLRTNQLSGVEGFVPSWMASGGTSFGTAFSGFFLPLSFTPPMGFPGRVLARSFFLSFFLFLLLDISRSLSLLGIDSSSLKMVRKG